MTKTTSILRSFIFLWLLFGHSSHRFPLLTSSGRRRSALAGSAPFRYSEAAVFLFSWGFRIMQMKHENKSSLRWRRTAFTNPGNFKSSLTRHPSPFSRTSLLAPCQSILNPAPLRSLLTKHLKVYSEASVLASFWKCRNQGMHVLSVSVGWLWVLLPVWFSLPFAAYSFTWTGALTQFPLRFPLFWYYLEGNRTWGGSTLRPRETHLPNRVGWASVGASHFSWLWREG